MPAPDPLRLRYRSQVREAVRGVVLSAGDIDDAALRAALAPGVDAADLEALVAITFNELHHLYEGNIARFGLRLSEYERWAARPR
jgi:hypothetical protein